MHWIPIRTVTITGENSEHFAEIDSGRAIHNIHRTKVTPKFVFAVLVLMAFTAAPAAESASEPKTLPPPKRVVIPKLRGMIKMDGELSESIWTRAASVQGFFENYGSRREREHTEVRLWYDDTALYIGWVCKDIDIQATFTNRDSKFWEEEVVEMFITPKPLDKYFELQWNPLGGVFDAIITNTLDAHAVSKAFEGDWSFTANG